MATTYAVVGGSLAGLRAAEALRREGFTGRLLIVSGEPFLPYDRPPMSKQLLSGAWEPEQARLRGADELDAEWLLGRRATGFDADRRIVVLDDGGSIACDGILIATGAMPRSLPGAEDLEGVHVLRTLDDCLSLRASLEHARRVVVVGAGFIGSEVASTCRERGLEVTVLEALPVPLARVLGPEMGRICGQLHGANGVDLRTETGVEGLAGDDRGAVSGVRLIGGEVVPADVVVVGIGVIPSVEWLEGSGLELANGVVCDARCQAAPGVVAAGDVARWYNPLFERHMRVEHWTNAAEQGLAAARTLLFGEGAEPFAPVPYFWSDQYGTKIQFLGDASPPDDEVRVIEGSPEEGRFVAAYGRDGRTVGALLFNRPARIPRFKTLIAERAPFPPPA